MNPFICYAIKANPNIAILKILSKLGAGAEVVSEGELKRSIKANINPKKIIFSGVGKTYKELQFAIKKNILQINVESLEEINLIEPKLKKDVLKVFDLKYSINSKTSYGGTSFENIKKMIKSYKKKHD